MIGIVGGIGSGKSTVAKEFGKLGCAVIDADEIAHALLKKPDVISKVIARFGPCIADQADRIDRGKLAEIVFADRDELSALNDILHPIVLGEVEKKIADSREDDIIKGIVLDMPLLVEVGWSQRCDIVVYVKCRQELRLRRAKKLGILDENDVKIRENFQISLDSKENHADNTIDNNSDFSSLVRQVAEIFSYILDNG